MPFLIEKANALDRLELMRPHLIQTKDLTTLEYHDSHSPSGRALPVEEIPDGYIVRGVCGFNERGPDAIILAYDTGDKRAIAFAMTHPVKVPASILTGVSHLGTWNAAFTLNQLPRSVVAITAWGFDASTGRTYLITQVDASRLLAYRNR
jgi:hypothetical protein